jgi:hypothetical protein
MPLVEMADLNAADTGLVAVYCNHQVNPIQRVHSCPGIAVIFMFAAIFLLFELCQLWVAFSLPSVVWMWQMCLVMHAARQQLAYHVCCILCSRGL